MPSSDRHILVIAYDRLGPVHAGPAIRTLALARQLSKIADVDILYEGEKPEESAERISFIKRESVTPSPDFFSRYHAALAPPLVAMTFPEVLATDIPLAVDLFDPVVWENLELYRSRAPGERKFQHERHLAALMAGLHRGDFFLAAGSRQQDLFIGALMTLNRINPETWRHGAGPEQIVVLVPFGLPEHDPPSKKDLSLPGEFKTTGPSVVWGGGLWDWLSPEIVVRAFRHVVDKIPDAKLAFPGTRHPNPHVPEPAALDRVKQAAKDNGLEDSVIYGSWLPRDEYLALLANAACGVSAHVSGLESRYAVRTRFLDAFWMGLPMVVSGGDEYSDRIAGDDLGVVIDNPEPEAFAKGIITVLGNGRGMYAGNFERARSELAWPVTSRPLMDWMSAPVITHGVGAEFFRETTGEGVAGKRPTDLKSIVDRLISKITK
jgi:glycosyltransferase involved in cell wall biosynthesis